MSAVPARDEARLRLVAAAQYLAYGIEDRLPFAEAIDHCRKLLDAAEQTLGDATCPG